MTINERAAICAREAEQLGLKLVRNFGVIGFGISSIRLVIVMGRIQSRSLN
jgi:hypothetical protein